MANEREYAARRNVQNTSQRLRTSTGPKKSQASASVPKNKAKLDKGAIVLILLVFVAAVTLGILLLRPNKVTAVSVRYTDAAKQLAVREQKTDQDFIRQSGVMGQKLSERANWEKAAGEKISQMGNYVLTGIGKTGRKSIELMIGSRIPLAVASIGGSYFIIDEEGYVLDKRSKYTDEGYLLINGLSLKNLYLGQQALDTSTDNRLSNAILVVKTLNEHGLAKFFTEIYMRENKDVWLISTYGIAVNINLWYEETLPSDLSAAINLIQENSGKGLKGGVVAVNGHCYWKEDLDGFMPIKGK